MKQRLSSKLKLMVKVAEADRRARGGVEPLMTMGKGSSEKGTIAVEEICDGWQSQREDFEVHGENRHLRRLGEPGSGLLGVPLITAHDPIFKIDDRCPIINVGLMNSDAVTTETIVSLKGEKNR
ncbi:unnamed protein product [Ilex paraguariensis]|uniref:Uncharacterized protein n=1 Tax=Ilex paraguariensis TaxID=185542 RepID=A0ABC8S5B0_9AQUA